jgi:hypothetical protein
MSANGTNIWDISNTFLADAGNNNSVTATVVDGVYKSDVYTDNPYVTIVTTDNTAPLYTDNTWWNDSIYDSKVTPAIKVKGDANIDGKLLLQGKDIGEVLSKIEQRLAILSPNPKLEEKWTALKELGDQYRKLEEEILAQEKIYDILSK